MFGMTFKNEVRCLVTFTFDLGDNVTVCTITSFIPTDKCICNLTIHLAILVNVTLVSCVTVI